MTLIELGYLLYFSYFMNDNDPSSDDHTYDDVKTCMTIIHCFVTAHEIGLFVTL